MLFGIEWFWWLGLVVLGIVPMMIWVHYQIGDMSWASATWQLDEDDPDRVQ